MTVLPDQMANRLVRAQKPHLEIRMIVLTDQKVGGSSPSERAKYFFGERDPVSSRWR